MEHRHSRREHNIYVGCAEYVIDLVVEYLISETKDLGLESTMKGPLNVHSFAYKQNTHRTARQSALFSHMRTARPFAFFALAHCRSTERVGQPALLKALRMLLPTRTLVVNFWTHIQISGIWLFLSPLSLNLNL